MSYDDAVVVVRENYGWRADKIIDTLSGDAVVALMKLHGQNVKRDMSDHTLNMLGAMESGKQVSYLTNPLLAFLIDGCVGSICNGAKSEPAKSVETKVVPAKVVPVKVVPVVVVKPPIEEESEDDAPPLMDFF